MGDSSSQLSSDVHGFLWSSVHPWGKEHAPYCREEKAEAQSSEGICPSLHQLGFKPRLT